MIARRELLRRTGLVLVGSGIATTGNGVLDLVMSARAEGDPSVDDVMKAGPLPEKMLGSPTAPVVILEYASMTCAHCAHFANVTLPALKASHIDGGRVRYVFREFPLDGLAAAASMLARSVDDDKFFSVIEVLFARQREWVANRIQPLMTLATKQLGFTEARFNEVLEDKQLFEKLTKARERGESLGVHSTPSFFINGKKQNGNVSIETMDKLIQPYLKT